MKQYAYIRVSTATQSYDRQLHTFNEYFKCHGIDPSTITFVSEKITTYTRFTEREIYNTINNAESGDIIYACQLDRFGRSVQDVLDLVDFAMDKGVKLVTLDGHTLENKTPMGRMILTMLAAFAEMERSLRAERCQAGKEAEKEELERNGYRIARCSGKIQTRRGREKGCDLTIARKAAAHKAVMSKLEWKEKSMGYQWAIEKIQEGWSRKAVIEEFNKMHDRKPDIFCTRSGKKLSHGILCLWIQEAGIM